MIIQNGQVGQIVRDETKTTLIEGFSNQMLPNVVAVIDVSPSFHPLIQCRANNATTSSASSTIFSADARKRTKIHGVMYSIQKDATCDAASGVGQVKGLIGSYTSVLAQIPLLTLTAQSMNVSMWFQKPIEVDKGSAISFAQGTFTVGSFIRSAVVFMSEED